MIIGIDLDNTIIDYTNAFKEVALKNNIIDNYWIENNKSKKLNFFKESLKKHLLKKPNGQDKWEFIQGQVYGKYIKYANLFPGVKNFFILSKEIFDIYIISHKTNIGHQTNINIRKKAINFLKRKEIIGKKTGISEKSIFFADNLELKISSIKENKCNFFIDDLQAILLNKSFPKSTKKIYFSSNKNNKLRNIETWNEISNIFFDNINNSFIKNIFSYYSSENILKIKPLKDGKNSSVFKIKTNKNEFFFKNYKFNRFNLRNRIDCEYISYKFLLKNKINIVPKPLWKDQDLNIAIYSWINGKKIINPKIKNVKEIINFINKLKLLSHSKNSNNFSFNASAACFSGHDIEKQLLDRYNNIYKNILVKKNKLLHKFLKENLKPTINQVLKTAKIKLTSKFYKKIIKKKMLLSPSDLGFHNIIVSNNKLNYIDFEYVGWDDPVKLTSDFLLHPGMFLTKNLKKLWLSEMLELFSDDKSFKIRLKWYYYLYALCWSLIQLNDYLDSNNNLKTTSHMAEMKSKLNNSVILLEKIKKNYIKGFSYVE